jgi:hypothetical protein
VADARNGTLAYFAKRVDSKPKGVVALTGSMVRTFVLFCFVCLHL